VDDEHLSTIICQVFNIIDSLDAGGKPLSAIYQNKRNLLSTKCWLIILEVYGSYLAGPLDDTETDHREVAINSLKTATDELSKLASDSEFLTNPVIVQICKDIT
jgi:hypothetical protein